METLFTVVCIILAAVIIGASVFLLYLLNRLPSGD